MRSTLFRPEAQVSQQQRLLGNIILIRPLSHSLLVGLVFLLSCVFLVFLYSVNYTNRVSVNGYLVPDQGVVKVMVNQAGIIQQSLVHEGQRVKAGQALFKVSSEKFNQYGEIQSGISDQVRQRKQSLEAEILSTQHLHDEEVLANRQKIKFLNDEMTSLQQQVQSQNQSVQVSQQVVQRFQELKQRGFASADQFQQKQSELLEQQNRLLSLQRELSKLRREIQVEGDNLLRLPLQHKNQLAQLQRSLQSTQQELHESEARRSILVTAPEAGVVTQITTEQGQTAELNRPLLSIVPEHAVLQAHLYVPSRAIGFVKPGDKVLLRYQAFPFQKYGHADGKVRYVSRVAAPLSELSNLLVNSKENSEALYKITVDLSAQELRFTNQTHALQAGMALDADILQEQRRLIEWVFEPLLGWGNKL